MRADREGFTIAIASRGFVATIPGKMTRSRVFGLLVEADSALWPGTEPSEPEPPGAEPDLSIVAAAGPEQALDGDSARPVVVLDREVATVTWPGVGRCQVLGGRRIEVYRVPGGDPARAEALVRAIAVPVALAQRGRILLHGSAVRLGASAVCFLGASRMGKSTLAAALAQRGHELVSDGITVLERGAGTAGLASGAGTAGSELRAWPGPPLYRLWPDAIAHLGDEPERYAPALPGLDKRAVPAAGIARAPVPLARLYVLAPGDEERREPLTAAEAAVALAQQSFLAEYVAGTSRAALFADAAEVARCLPVSRLYRRQQLEHLPSLLDLIEAELARE